MECLTDLILLFSGLFTPTTAPILTILMLLSMTIRQIRPCLICVLIMYLILLATLVTENDIGRHLGGIFNSLRITPDQLELSILLRVRYDPFAGYVKNPVTYSTVLSPKESFGNFLMAFVKYLIEPSYGKIYRQ